jgi:hypothetical protein
VGFEPTIEVNPRCRFSRLRCWVLETTRVQEASPRPGRDSSIARPRRSEQLKCGGQAGARNPGVVGFFFEPLPSGGSTLLVLGSKFPGRPWGRDVGGLAARGAV